MHHTIEKEQDPDTDVFILYRDMRMYSMLEDYYTRARNLGVIFSRFDPEDAPEVAKGEDGRMAVTFTDHVLGQKIEAGADLVALSAGVKAADTQELARIIKSNRNAEGFFIEAHVKLSILLRTWQVP